MINLQLLGGVVVTGTDASSGLVAPRRRALALLTIVAAAEPQPVTREKLLALLWPESDTDRARNNLRQAVFALRRDLREDPFLPESRNGLRLDAAHIRVDLWEFRDALARNAPDEAEALYRGPFLDGFHIAGLVGFSQWLDQERDRIAWLRGNAVEAMAQRAERDGRLDEVVAWRRRRASADPLNGRAALALLKALAAAGDREAALEYARQHERLIRQELEVEPDPVITEFVSALRATPSFASRAVVPATDSRSVETSAAIEMPANAGDALPSATRTRRGKARPAWFAIGFAVLLVATVMGGKLLADPRSTDIPPVVILSSGGHPNGNRDPSNRLVECEGPACPATTLPQDAYIVAAHSAYSPPPIGSTYISPVSDATTKAPPGYACCTVATFENTFRLPKNAVSATIMLSASADNQAIVQINGVEFGRQKDRLADANYSDGSRFVTTFAPDPSGTNHLRVTLWDGGGALGLQYLATVTYHIANRRKDSTIVADNR